MNDHIESELSRLPEPAPPASLAAVVMARVSRLHDEQSALSQSSRARRVLDRSAWLAALAGVVIVSVSWINTGHDGGSVLEMLSQMQVPNQEGLPASTPAAAGLVLGLLLYLVGLIAPHQRPRTQGDGSGSR